MTSPYEQIEKALEDAYSITGKRSYRKALQLLRAHKEGVDIEVLSDAIGTVEVDRNFSQRHFIQKAAQVHIDFFGGADD